MSQNSQPVEASDQVTRKIKICSKDVSIAFENETAKIAHYYTITFYDQATMTERVARCNAYEIDEERNLLLDAQGNPIQRDPVRAAISAWAIIGHEQYDILEIFLGAKLLMTSQDICAAIINQSNPTAIGIDPATTLVA